MVSEKKAKTARPWQRSDSKFADICEAGVLRHGAAFYNGSRQASELAQASGIDIQKHKTVLSLIVLRVLDSTLTEKDVEDLRKAGRIK